MVYGFVYTKISAKLSALSAITLSHRQFIEDKSKTFIARLKIAEY